MEREVSGASKVDRAPQDLQDREVSEATEENRARRDLQEHRVSEARQVRRAWQAPQVHPVRQANRVYLDQWVPQELLDQPARMEHRVPRALLDKMVFPLLLLTPHSATVCSSSRVCSPSGCPWTVAPGTTATPMLIAVTRLESSFHTWQGNHPTLQLCGAALEMAAHATVCAVMMP